MSNRRDQELDQLFAEYRDSFPDPEPGRNFMPQLWERIESRRNFPALMHRATRGFLTAAAALCMAMGTIAILDNSSRSASFGSYIDALEAHQADSMMAMGEGRADIGEASQR